MKKFVSILLCGVLIFGISSVSFSKECKVKNINHYAQQKRTYCGPAVAQMWIDNIGAWRSQNDIASGDPGMDAYEMERTLEKFTGKGFSVNGHSGEKSARKRIYKELRKQKRPLAISGTTVRSDGSYRVMGHWLLIWATDIKSKSSSYKVKWVKVMDPLRGSQWQGSYQTLYKHDKLKRDKLFGKHWRSRKNYRQSVDD